MRLGYASHIHRAQGATVDRTLVVTGGWQTSKESAYVEASRARHGTDWYVNRDDLGTDGHDTDRIKRLAREHGTKPHANTIPRTQSHSATTGHGFDHDLNRAFEPPGPRLPGIIRTLHRATEPPAPERDTMTSEKRIRRSVPRLAFNQQEAAEALGISVDHFERHVKADLPVVYSGSLRLYPRQALEQWLERSTRSDGGDV